MASGAITGSGPRWRLPVETALPKHKNSSRASPSELKMPIERD